MKVIQTDFDGLLVLEPQVYIDDRGYFFEAYNRQVFKSIGLDFDFVQDNESRSKFGVLRGLHFQRPPKSQTKLVRVVTGEILDVVVDLRQRSTTFAKYFTIKLSSENRKQLLVPKGFAHGFVVLSEAAEVVYKCDEFYDPKLDGGLRFDDPTINIPWRSHANDLQLSEKDRRLPFLPDVNLPF